MINTIFLLFHSHAEKVNCPLYAAISRFRRSGKASRGWQSVRVCSEDINAFAKPCSQLQIPNNSTQLCKEARMPGYR